MVQTNVNYFLYFDYEDILPYKLFLYINFLISFLTNIIGFLLILKYTPKIMGVYKWFLLNILV